MSINHDAKLLLTGTAKANLSIFDVRQPAQPAEVIDVISGEFLIYTVVMLS